MKVCFKCQYEISSRRPNKANKQEYVKKYWVASIVMFRGFPQPWEKCRYIERARKQLGYLDKTADCDIMLSLKKEYQKMREEKWEED